MDDKPRRPHIRACVRKEEGLHVLPAKPGNVCQSRLVLGRASGGSVRFCHGPETRNARWNKGRVTYPELSEVLAFLSAGAVPVSKFYELSNTLGNVSDRSGGAMRNLMVVAAKGRAHNVLEARR